MTCSELAERMVISDTFCANIENGVRGKSVPKLITMSEVLGVTVDDLVYEKHESVRFRELETKCRHKSDGFTKKIEEIAITLIDLLE